MFYADLQPGSDIWHYEDGQTMSGSSSFKYLPQNQLINIYLGVSAVKRWASVTDEVISPDDILISADVDEVLSQDALLHLQYCHLVTTVISGAIVMPMGNLEMAFR